MRHRGAQMKRVASQQAASQSPLHRPPDVLARDGAIATYLAGARAHLGVETAFVTRCVEEGLQQVTHLCTADDLPLEPGAVIAHANSLLDHGSSEISARLIPDSGEHPLPPLVPEVGDLRIGCFACAPLRLSDGTLWGSLCVLGKEPDPTLTMRDLKIVESFSGLAAERIESALERDRREQAAQERVESMLDGHGITTFQQPIVSLASGAPVGVECLSRFPDLTKRGPDAWFEDAELVGLGEALELAALRCALETLGHVPKGLFATINVSPRTLRSGAVRSLLEDTAITDLVVEIAGPLPTEDMATLAREIEALRPLARIAFDNVTPDLDGLQRVVELRPDYLKLDMMLARGIEGDRARQALVAALVILGRSVGCTVIAQGIEDEAEEEAFNALGIDCGQGYLYSRPLPTAAAQQYLLGFVQQT